MKRFTYIFLTLSVLLNFYMIASRTKQVYLVKKYPVDSNAFFAITNLPESTNTDAFIVSFKEGRYWWTIDGNVISMNIGLNQEATLRLDEKTGQVKSTTLELIGTNGMGRYFTDMNADGIPDKMRIAGQEENPQIFYKGEFTPSFNMGNKRYISISGSNILVKFNGTEWVTN